MGDLIRMRDYKTREEREAEINRLGLAIVTEALAPEPDYYDMAGNPRYQAPEKDPA